MFVTIGGGTSASGASGGGGGTGITSLTGDVNASGPGAAVATLPNVNSNVGSFGDASHALVLVLNAKGLATALSQVAIEIAASAIVSGQLALAQGGTHNDLSATGPGFLKQASLGSDVTVAPVTPADVAGVEQTVHKDAANGYAGLDAGSKLAGAELPYGTAANTACQGNDARLSDARTPTAHAATHAAAGSDPVTLTEAQITNLSTDLAAKVAKGGDTMTGELVAPDFSASGLIGATAGTRYVGATLSGAPASGAFVIGDFVIARDGHVWVCIAAGSPGTWVDASASSGMTNPMTTQDDLIVGGSSGTPARLAKGSSGQVLTVNPSTGHLDFETPGGGNVSAAVSAGALLSVYQLAGGF